METLNNCICVLQFNVCLFCMLMCFYACCFMCKLWHWVIHKTLRSLRTIAYEVYPRNTIARLGSIVCVCSSSWKANITAVGVVKCLIKQVVKLCCCSTPADVKPCSMLVLTCCNRLLLYTINIYCVHLKLTHLCWPLKSTLSSYRSVVQMSTSYGFPNGC